MEKLSPMMQHYLNTKAKYNDSILFYRLGDFYETFFEDAVTASRELEITLTGKACGLDERAPMCGVPYHSVNTYISRLIAKGYSVAICEQMEDANAVKGLVKREVTRVITPGTVIDENMLDEKNNNYLACVYAQIDFIGVAFADITTGEVFATAFESDKTILFNEIARYEPAEIIVNKYVDTMFGSAIRDRFKMSLKLCDDEVFDYGNAKLVSQFKRTAEDMGIDGKPYLVSCIGGLISYFQHTQKTALDYLSDISVYNIKQFMDIDMTTRRNLEITESMRDRSKRGTLLWALDKTKTSMGARLLKQWLEKPLVNPVAITKRLYAVNEFVNNPIMRDDMTQTLAGIYDIARIVVRISLNTATPADMISLKKSIEKLPDIKAILDSCTAAMLKDISESFDEMKDVYDLINEAIKDDAPAILRDGGIIKEGYSEEVDELRYAMTDGKQWIAQIENEEKEKTGIKNLKISFNKVFGYYIEVTKSNLKDVPERYIRKQTLANCERYITEELKNVENTIVGASEKIIGLENEIYNDIRKRISGEVERLKRVCDAVAKTDVLCSLAVTASKNGYVMPEICESGEIAIMQGRHPVVEQMLKDEIFVPNDIMVNNKNSRLMIITGPNMAGKSTYMRQTALITLMAQTGSFVPAESARISAVDKIFTRVGASDDIASGQSTFMVEMSEVANILKNATNNSLIIMDEIGRGTSTFDGLSIAWAVAEYIEKKIKAKTLFATHYHEMTLLENKYDGIVNYHIAVKKYQEKITFLRRVIKGAADGSYGIEVAALAGVPKEVTSRAKKILRDLEKSDINNPAHMFADKEDDAQMGFSDNMTDNIIEELRAMNVTSLTPMEALNILFDLNKRANEFVI